MQMSARVSVTPLPCKNAGLDGSEQRPRASWRRLAVTCTPVDQWRAERAYVQQRDADRAFSLSLSLSLSLILSLSLSLSMPV